MGPGTSGKAGSAGPGQVRARLARHVLTDGFHLILDLRRSSGCWLTDARTGERYLDLYSFFASSPLGINPPDVTEDP
ncbi:MAG: L-lysine 6-transaminase, partial [Actinobacteria bacterium]|nr:L-lysine 6-transaminase [Actinomycetota bacterium]